MGIIMNSQQTADGKQTDNRIAIVYYSKTGFTKKYAEWIREGLAGKMSCDLVPFKERRRIAFGDYAAVLFGGGFHAGQINGLKWFKAQIGKMPAQFIQNGRIAVFATGAMPVEAPDVEKSMRKNFTEQEWEQIKTFYLPGGLCYEKMGAGDKLMMSMFRAMLKEAKVDSKMQEIVAHSFDMTSKEAAAPIVDWCVHAVSRTM